MKIFNKINFIILITLVCFIHGGTLLTAINITTTKILSYILYGYGSISIILYIIYKLINKKNINIYDILILILTILAIISTVFAYDKNTALYGEHTRYEGLFSILSYYSIFLLASTIDYKKQKIIMNIIISFGLFQILLGTIQILHIENIFGYDRSQNWSANFYSASGTLTNPNFYSTYILMCTLYLYIQIFKSNGIKKILLSILTAIFIYGLIIGNTTSSMLIFFLLAIIILLLNLNYRKIKKNIFPIIICLLLSGSVLLLINKANNHSFSKIMKTNYYSIYNIFKYGIKDSTGHYRIHVWKETLKEVPKHLYTGIGIDNFKYIKNGNPIIVFMDRQSVYFDKAHNDYLQILITQGIFALISYLILLISILYIGFKNKKHTLLLPFIGYILQMIIVFSVIMVAPFFYIIMGFIIHKNESLIEESNMPI